jgi:hypothetical protein
LAKRRFSKVDLPAPEGPEITIGRSPKVRIVVYRGFWYLSLSVSVLLVDCCLTKGSPFTRKIGSQEFVANVELQKCLHFVNSIHKLRDFSCDGDLIGQSSDEDRVAGQEFAFAKLRVRGL